MFILNKKVLITGIEGFTGTYLEDTLVKKGYEVYGTSLNNSTKTNVFTCDITKRIEVETIVKDVAPNFIIHLAAISFVAEKNSSLMYDVNVIGTENLLESLLLLSTKPQKVILASSATIYGNQAHSMLEECMCPKPISHYGFSKLIMEHLAITYFEKLPILIVRPFNYTGVGQDEHFLIPKIIKHYKENLPSIELGNIDVAREFNDVRDIASWYTDLLTSNAINDIVNLCSGKSISLHEIIQHMNCITNRSINIKINPLLVRKNEIKDLFGSNKKLHSLISAQNNISIYETLKTMYNS